MCEVTVRGAFLELEGADSTLWIANLRIRKGRVQGSTVRLQAHSTLLGVYTGDMYVTGCVLDGGWWSSSAVDVSEGGRLYVAGARPAARLLRAHCNICGTVGPMRTYSNRSLCYDCEQRSSW